ncbi:MAG TPA: peptidylprolyl isomerase [Candidatus Saccharimonadales bacterium]|jgi:type III secretion system FlhB-like substrate exporter|nr:peptidylprolyl isomerase [Candidatus Saccharimonadales bacterium]
MKHNAKKILSKIPVRRKKKDVAARFDEAVQNLPKITNDTVSEHREEVLSTARKYIYPLQHSKHRIVVISTILFTLVVLLFFSYCGLALYRFQSNSGFIYGVTQVIPFPIAKAGPSYVSYDSYLFELRHYTHYYQTQQGINFNSPAGKDQLNSFKHQALREVIADAFVKQLASRNNVSVSSQQLNNEVDLIRYQDGLSNNEKEFEDVLSQFWGWTVADFKQELKQQLLSQDVVAKLDTATNQRAQSVLAALQNGADFGTLAGEYSDDTTTKSNGGQFSFLITQTTRNLSPQTLNTILNLKPGQISGIINIGNALEIDKVISTTNGNIQAAHILFNFNSINTYLQPLEAKEKIHTYIKLPA